MKLKCSFIALFSALALMSVPSEAYAQGFLNKLKQKVGEAVGIDLTEESSTVKTNSDQSPSASAPASATDILPKLRQSAVVWDAEVQPSRAANARALLAELPALPTASEIANPSEATRAAYYNKLSAINMRVDELDQQYTCSDEEILAARDGIYKELTGTLGLSVEEMKRLDDPNISESERKSLEDKMSAHLLGGASVDEFTSKAESYEARIEELSKEAEALEAKERKGTITQAERDRAAELSKEMMTISMNIMGGMSGVMEIADKSAALTAKMTKYQDRLTSYANKVASLRQNENRSVKTCEQIAKDYESELEGIYSLVWEEKDPVKIHALYDEADEYMKKYRGRAASVYLAGLQTRLDNTKKLMSEAEALYADMASNELIPQCATRRAPLNVVTDCVDILYEAYSTFPQPDVLPVKKENIALLNEGERLLLTESGYAGGFTGGFNSASGSAESGSGIVEEFKNKSELLVYNEKDNCYYKISGGKRMKLDGDGPFDFKKKEANTARTYGEIPLRGGGRKAVYGKDGSLTLHDGTILYPLAIGRYEDHLEFITLDYSSEKASDSLVKCTYKL